MGICHSDAPDGRCISLLKILLTNSCIFDCHYCINRKSSNVRGAGCGVRGSPFRTWLSSRAIFNSARLKIGAMCKEMPKKYWRNMPETALISGLIAGAQRREQAMIAASPSG